MNLEEVGIDEMLDEIQRRCGGSFIVLCDAPVEGNLAGVFRTHARPGNSERVFQMTSDTLQAAVERYEEGKSS